MTTESGEPVPEDFFVIRGRYKSERTWTEMLLMLQLSDLDEVCVKIWDQFGMVQMCYISVSDKVLYHG